MRQVQVPVNVICLCGSTRFTAEMLILQWNLTKRGHIVLSWCALPDNYFRGQDKTHIGDQEGVKEIVDEVHKRKIDLSDEVLVVNIGGYIGESTRSEILYAMSTGVPVRYLEPYWHYSFIKETEDDDSLHRLARDIEARLTDWCRCQADMLCPVCRQTIQRVMEE